MQHKISLTILLSSVLLTFGFISQCTSSQQNQQPQQDATAQSDAATPELAEYMSTMQYYTHKFALSVDAEHQELAQFYFHEIRALSDQIKEDIPGYEGYDIARFMRIFMDPAIQPIEDALNNDNWEKSRAEVINLIDTCNSCHNATGHGFVNVTPGFEKNPYTQDFTREE